VMSSRRDLPRIGLIGLGHMGLNHLKIMLMHRRRGLIEISGIYDIDQEKTGELSQRYRVRAYTSLDELVEDQPDGVIIATPTQTHLEVFREVVEGVKNILVEKPPAATADEAEEMHRLALEKGATVMVGMIERFNPAVVHMLRYTRVMDRSLIFNSCRTSRPRGRTDVGVTLDLAIHDLHILSQLVELDDVETGGWRVVDKDGNEVASNLVLEGGRLRANLYSSYIHGSMVRRIEMLIEDTWIYLDMIGKSVEVYGPGGHQEYSLEGDALRNEHLHFLSVIEGAIEPTTPLTDIIPLMRLLEEAENQFREIVLERVTS